MNVITLNKDNFEEEVLKSDLPVLVDFWAVWCGPCKMISPIVDEIAEEAEGFKVGKVDCDSNEELCVAYGVSSIPTLLVFKDGKMVNKSVGAIPKESILKLLEL